MPIEAKSDGNVPFTGLRPRFSIVGTSPCWHYHRMDAGAPLDGTAPRSVADNEAEIDPEVSAGLAEWTALTKGGLFTHLAKAKQSVIVEATDISGGVTTTIVDFAGNLIRTLPTAPFRLAPGEVLKSTGGSNGGHAGFLIRLDASKIL